MVDHIKGHILVYSFEACEQVEGIFAWQVLSYDIVVFLVFKHLKHSDDIRVVLGLAKSTIYLRISNSLKSVLPTLEPLLLCTFLITRYWPVLKDLTL